jgi:hypothetical protein
MEVFEVTKRTMFGAAVVVAMLMVNLEGCAAWRQEARVQAVSPAVEQAWPGIKADAEAGAADRSDLAAVETMAQAVDSGDCREVARVGAVVWPEVERLATEGIALRLSRGEIGPGVAQSKLERLALFAEAIPFCGEPTDPEGGE